MGPLSLLALLFFTNVGALSKVSVDAAGSAAAPGNVEVERMPTDGAVESSRRVDLFTELSSLRNESSAQFALIAEQFASQAAELSSLRKESMEQFALIAEQFAAQATELSSLRKESTAQFALIAEQFAAQAIERASDRADIIRRFDSVNENLYELLSSTQTPRSAVVDACAQRSVLHITYPQKNKNKFSICSAFA